MAVDPSVALPTLMAVVALPMQVKVWESVSMADKDVTVTIVTTDELQPQSPLARPVVQPVSTFDAPLLRPTAPTTTFDPDLTPASSRTVG